MDIVKFKLALAEFLAQYPEMHLAVVGVAFTADDTSVRSHGMTFIRRLPKDHEENLVRDHVAKKLTKIASDLLNDTYQINDSDGD